MSKGLAKVAVIAGAIALVATGVGAVAGAAAASATAGSAAAVSAAAVAATAGSIATYASLAAGLASIGAQITAKKPPARGTINQVVIDANGLAPYIIGETYSGGILRHDVGYGATLKKVPNPYRGQVIVYSVAGPVEGLVDRYLDFAPVSFSGDAATGYFSGFLYSDYRRGLTPETALTPHWAGMPGWSAAHKLSASASILWNGLFDKDGKRFASGWPATGAVWKGVKCYDPRKDSTYPGGSGPHRWADPADTVAFAAARATWEYSECPGLHGLKYALGVWERDESNPAAKYQLRFGVGMPTHGIIMADFVTLANVCDANGWKAGGVLYEPGDTWANFKRIIEAGAAEPLWRGGKLGLKISAPRVSIYTITEADLAEGDAEMTGMQTYRSRLNGIRPKYRSAANKWEYVPSDLVSVPSYVTEDGEPKIEEAQWDLVQDKDQVAQLAAYRLVNGRELAPLTLPFKSHMRHFGPGDMITFNLPRHGLEGIDAVIIKRSLDPATMVVQLSFMSETTGKHAYALGQTGTAPATPALASRDARDTISKEIAQAASAGPSFGVVTSAGIALTGIKLSRTAPYTGAWDQGWRSVESYLGGASLTIRLLDSQWLETFFGLNDDPAADDDYVGINYSLQLSYSSGSRYVYLRDGASIAWVSPTGFFADGDVFNIHYNGKDVRFTRNGVPFGPAISAAAGQRLFMDGSNASANGTAAFAELIGFTAAGPAGVDGVPGSAGAPGAPGANGVTHYNWIAFADSPDGTVNFTTGAPNGRAYRGEAVNMTTSTESTNPADYVWSQYTGARGFGVVTSSGLQLAGDRLIRLTAGGAWDQGWYSSESFTGGCSVSGRVLTTTDTVFMLGLNTDPAADNDYTSLDHAIYVDWYGGDRRASVFESGSSVWSSAVGFISVGDVISIHYDGRAVRYAKNGTVFYTNTTVAAGLTFWMDGSVAWGNGTQPFLQLLSFNGAGAVGATGAAGVPGSPGAPGATIYTHYAYADSSDGQINFGTGSPNGRTWQGVRYNQPTPVESTNPADYTWSPYTGPAAFGLVASSGAQVSGNKLVRTAAYSAGWDQQIYSTEGFYQGATVRFKPLDYSGQMGAIMVGLNTDPTSGGWDTLDHAFYLESTSTGIGRLYIAESGSIIATGWVNYDASQIFTIVYDNDRVRYYANGALIRDVDVAPDLTFYMDSALAEPGARALLLDFSPLGKRGADGSPGSPGAPGANAISPELSSYSVTVPCFSDGSVKPGGLDAATGTFRLRSGGSLITSGIGFAVLAATSGSSATIDGSGNFAVTGLGSAEPVEITLRASYGGNNFDLKYTVTKARSGTNATANSVNVTGNIPNSTTYDVVQTVDLSVPAGNYIDGTASGSYDPPYGGSSVSYTCIPTFKLTVQNLTDGGAAVQIGSEVNGTAAQWFAEDVSGNSGSLSGISGSGQNTTGAAKTFRLTLWAKRAGGNAGAGFTSGSLSIGARA